MNPQISPWMKIQDKQRMSDLKRNQQERYYKNILRDQYYRELQDQIKQKQAMKKQQLESQKEYERSLINRSIQNSKNQIEMEKKKAQMLNEEQHRMQKSTQFYKEARRQRENYMEHQNRITEHQLNRRAQESERIQKEMQQRKKKALLEDLKQTMQYKNDHEKFKRNQEKQLEKNKMRENEMLLEREDRHREEYLNKLKQKAMTIDYGSHSIVNQNKQKSLIEKKKREWEIDQLYSARSEFTNHYENSIKRIRDTAGKSYGDELKRQITERQRQKLYHQQRQLEQDRLKLDSYRQYSHSLELNKKEKEEKQKNELLGYLRKQIDEKNNTKKNGYLLKKGQFEMNLDVLRGNNVVIPGETYELDPRRRKQLETVARAMAGSPRKDNPPRNILMQRGKQLLG